MGDTPSVNDACASALTRSAIDGAPGASLTGSPSEVIPSRCAMSTTGATPVLSSSFTNAVLGDWASASVSVSCGARPSSALCTGNGCPEESL